MSNMLSALNLNDYSFKNQFKKKSREELIQLRDETKKNIARLHQEMIDYDDGFVSLKINEDILHTINKLLETKVKRSFKNCRLVFNEYYITIIDEYNILVKNDKLGIDVHYNDIGKVTGKGARKYIDEIEICRDKVRHFKCHNKWLKEKNKYKYICRTINKMTSKRLDCENM